MQLHTIDPLSDSRWEDLVASHPRASVFHHRGWLKALASTYGYQSVVLTSSPPGKRLRDGIVFCPVKSWITGNRAVSLPFADHCEPLLEDDTAITGFANWLHTECDRQQWKYVELRPLSWSGESGGHLVRGRSYCFHTLDLTPMLEQIFQRLHKDSIQRRIRHAERERLSYETGCSEQLVDDFYRLLLKTRRRHQLLPQPRAWFRNLVDCMGDKIQVRLARKDGVPIAAMLTLRHRSCMVYKYGCSDEKSHNLAGMPFLFWRLIEESKASGINEIDFGRSDLDNDGLITFKDRFGTTRKRLTYFQYPQVEKREGISRWDMPAIRRVFSILPDVILPMASGLLYKHIG
jgi:CelD/BcsL family acetyltransferase involved in cellulose biosynthesis